MFLILPTKKIQTLINQQQISRLEFLVLLICKMNSARFDKALKPGLNNQEAAFKLQTRDKYCELLHYIHSPLVCSKSCA